VAQEIRRLARADRPRRAISLAKRHTKGRGHLKPDIDDQGRRAIEMSLAERRSHLIEKAMRDSTLTPAR
jgi:hypothetical protein